ncbi:MAG: thiol peroxidase [Kiritimatiellaeota bacterium]|nr:thiol peroxidase [Kiritimatiellota bacterium]
MIHRGEAMLTLVGDGPGLRIGKPLPAVSLVDPELKEVALSSYLGRTLIISTVPSLDTPVCGRQTRHFNQVIADFGPNVALITVSEDLPFAQKRFCETEEIANIDVLSDYRDRDFARASGLLVKELLVLARAVIVADRNGIVRYVQVVPDLGQEPDYAAVLSFVRGLQAGGGDALPPTPAATP